MRGGAGGCGLEVCRSAEGKISQISADVGWEQTRTFNPRRTLVCIDLSYDLLLLELNSFSLILPKLIKFSQNSFLWNLMMTQKMSLKTCSHHHYQKFWR